MEFGQESKFSLITGPHGAFGLVGRRDVFGPRPAHIVNMHHKHCDDIHPYSATVNNAAPTNFSFPSYPTDGAFIFPLLTAVGWRDASTLSEV